MIQKIVTNQVGGVGGQARSVDWGGVLVIYVRTCASMPVNREGMRIWYDESITKVRSEHLWPGQNVYRWWLGHFSLGAHVLTSSYGRFLLCLCRWGL